MRPTIAELEAILASPDSPKIEILPNGEVRAVRKPSIGRIVHYTNLGDRDGKYPPEVQAAIITGVNADGTVALHVFYKTGQFDLPRVEQATIPGLPDGPAPEGNAVATGSEDARGKWQWPARE